MWQCLLKYTCSDTRCQEIISFSGEAYDMWLKDLYDTFQAECNDDRQLIRTDAADFIRMLVSSHVFNAPLFHNVINKDSIEKNVTIAGININ